MARHPAIDSLSERDTCNNTNDYDGKDFAVRISAVFVIFAVSALGSFLPLIASKCPYFKVPGWIFFTIRYFGSGVIVATGFIHLLAESSESLTNPCLGGIFDDYPWAEGIALMGVFVMFFLDIIAHKKIEQKVQSKILLESNAIDNNQAQINSNTCSNTNSPATSPESNIDKFAAEDKTEITVSPAPSSHQNQSTGQKTEAFYAQILNAFVLEFGIVFHSVFVGLSLAIAGDEFTSLYIAIAFHQMFEGLGLGTRFATTDWPANKQYTPWLLSLGYSLTTPAAIAVGIGVRHSYSPGSRTALITTGVFDGVCAGVLIYNSLVELMAYDFMYSSEFKNEQQGMRRMLLAFLFLSLGALAMAIIGKWA